MNNCLETLVARDHFRRLRFETSPFDFGSAPIRLIVESSLVLNRSETQPVEPQTRANATTDTGGPLHRDLGRSYVGHYVNDVIFIVRRIG